MVEKYIILANSNDETFNIPRQLVEIKGERLIERTIRLLKENGVKDITITAHDKRFNDLGVKVYDPKTSNYDYATGKGYWLNAFPFEMMNEPICFIWGDVYFSEEAIKTIVENDTNSTLFFCTYNNESDKYIKHHDEPLAYKVVDTDLFKEHITKVKKMYDDGLCCRHPIVWEVYRSINGIDVNTHIMTDNFIAINDISCDIDSMKDLKSIKRKVGEVKLIRVEAIEKFDLGRFDELENIKRAGTDVYGSLFIGDTFECTQDLVEYLTGNNPLNKAVVKVIEVQPEKVIEEVINKNIEEAVDNQVKETIKEVFEEKKPKKSKKSSKK